MKTGLYQGTTLKQEMKINPRLYQAMDLLYMPLLDLQQHLKQELLNNPFLDLVEPDAEDEAKEQEKDKEKEDDEIDWEEILLNGFETGGRREEYEEREYYEPVSVDTKDLGDHLHDQLTLLRLSERELLLGEEIIGNVSDEGYLVCGIDEIVQTLNDFVSDTPEFAGARRVHAGRGRAHAARHPGLRPGGDRRARPARVHPAAAARQRGDGRDPGDGRERSGPGRDRAAAAGKPGVPHRARLLRAADQPPLERDQQGALDHAARRAGRGGRGGQAGSQAGPQVLGGRGQLHHPRPDRGQDRGRVPGVPERHQPAAPQAVARLPRHRQGQEEVRGREQGVHQQQAELRQLDDPGDRAAPADHAQGDELHRGPAARLLREGRAVPQAAHPARGGRGHRHARVHRVARDQREVRADAARRVSAQVLLLVRPVAPRAARTCRRAASRRRSRSW